MNLYSLAPIGIAHSLGDTPRQLISQLALHLLLLQVHLGQLREFRFQLEIPVIDDKFWDQI